MVNFNLLSDRRDLDRLMTSFRRLGALYRLPAVKALISDPFPASYGEKVRQMSAMTRRNRLLTSAFAFLLDGPASLRSALLRQFVIDGPSFDTAMQDDDALEAFIRKEAVGVWHASCSCRMGADDDPLAVTDPAGRVRQVDGLRVVDASIFPGHPMRQRQFPDLDGGGKDRGRHPVDWLTDRNFAERSSLRASNRRVGSRIAPIQTFPGCWIEHDGLRQIEQQRNGL